MVHIGVIAQGGRVGAEQKGLILHSIIQTVQNSTWRKTSRRTMVAMAGRQNKQSLNVVSLTLYLIVSEFVNWNGQRSSVSVHFV